MKASDQYVLFLETGKQFETFSKLPTAQEVNDLLRQIYSPGVRWYVYDKYYARKALTGKVD